MIRIFYALKIPDNIKEFIIENRNRVCSETMGFKWESIDKFHVTLKFVGDINKEKLSLIFSDLNLIEKEFYSYECTLTKFDFFYRNSNPAILWIGLDTKPSLDKLVYRLNKIFANYGSKIENRKFNPHITLLRIKKYPGIDFIKSFQEYLLPEKKFITNETALIKSELLPAGSVYTELKKYNLKNMEEL